MQISLALILFLPTFAVLGALFCAYPKTPRGPLRVVVDVAALAVAVGASVLAMRWGFHAATGAGGSLWRHVLATLLAYGVFLGVLGGAWLLRAIGLRHWRMHATASAICPQSHIPAASS